MDVSNILTVDVEDWTGSSLSLLSRREASRARAVLPIRDRQVERGVRQILELLEQTGNSATFFVVGRTARLHKALVRDIQAGGHEIASHTMTHPLLPEVSASAFQEEITTSRKTLEDITGEPVFGFRAPCLAGFPDSSYFFRRLQAAGYRYDSSFTTDVADALLKSHVPVFPGRIKEVGESWESDTREFPVTTVPWGKRQVPLGGMYLKLMNPAAVSAQIHRENQQNRPAVLYVHPYEFDTQGPRWSYPSPSLRARWSAWVRGRRPGYHLALFRHLLRSHRFTSIRDI